MRKFNKDKPYDICLTCVHLGVACDGPNFLAMTHERWVEWIKARATILGMTHQKIADIANLAKGTVDAVLSGKNTDIRRDTMAAITHAVTGECWGKYPCHDPLEANKEVSELIHTIQEKDAEIEKLRGSAEKQEMSNQKKIDFLIEQLRKREEEVEALKARIMSKETKIYAAIVAAGIFALLLIVILGVDFFLPGWGLFRR